MIPIFNAEEGDILVKDLDSDSVEEVIMITAKNVGRNETTLEFIEEYYRRIYKWDTQKQEYYLWKEENLGKKKPKDIDGDGIPEIMG
jgi:hypothetical protein